MSTLHSYYPVGIDIPNYAANELSTPSLLAIFIVVGTIVLASSTSVAKYANPRIPQAELLTVFWFALCGTIHSILEGYYAISVLTIPGSQHILAQLWKEYSLSDSRYLLQDSFLWPMETVTAFCWGPIAFLLVVLIIKDHPLRHPLQMIISLGQLYGDVLYYGTCGFEFVVRGVEFSRPERYYFWGYFMFLNAIWIAVPFVLLYNSVKASCRAFAAAKSVKDKSGVNGSIKKNS
ncbi:EXPERA domain-containing protein [Aspergillus undulatus]|uniref:EXPERA domain-containing protein n=1 Tax=Aspergillus undulatus TaxID=1810928 RepID=UPI003CCE0857